MLEHFLKSNCLNINCEIACLTGDKGEVLEQYDAINLNCETYIASSSVNAKLLEKGANINSENIVITDYEGEFIQLSGGVISDTADYSGMYIIVSGDIVLQGQGVSAFEKAEKVFLSGTVYYPDACNQNVLSRIQGKKRAYPDGSFVLLGNQELQKLLADLPKELRQVWVAGEVSVFREEELQQAENRNLQIYCDSLFMPEPFFPRYEATFHTSDVILVPEGHKVTGPLTLNEATSVLYGKKLYVRGPFLIDQKNAEYLKEFESILVKGCASLPVSCAKAFKEVGQADHYQLYEGRLYHVNGWEMFSHDRLKTMTEKSDKITLSINGFVIFGQDVTAEDMEAIVSVSCNGFIVLPGAAQGALSQKTETINGFTVDMDSLQQMTGLSLPELVQKIGAGQKSGSGNINTDIYMLH